MLCIYHVNFDSKQRGKQCFSMLELLKDHQKQSILMLTIIHQCCLCYILASNLQFIFNKFQKNSTLKYYKTIFSRCFLIFFFLLRKKQIFYFKSQNILKKQSYSNHLVILKVLAFYF